MIGQLSVNVASVFELTFDVSPQLRGRNAVPQSNGEGQAVDPFQKVQSVFARGGWLAGNLNIDRA